MPKIFGITVSKNYAKILNILIESNSHIFYKWYIVTQEDDLDTIRVVENANKKNIELVFYPLVPSCIKPEHKKSKLKGGDNKFSIPDYIKPLNKEPTPHQKKVIKKLQDKGLIFDKGGAIRQIQKYHLPNDPYCENDLVLLIDSDIVLPSDLLDKIKGVKFEENTIYGSKRQDYMFHRDFLRKAKGIRYETYEGAGYFQLYRRSSNKICKRTYDCGWVDLEFKKQFKISRIFQNFYASHLGLPDMNWEGKTTECYLFDDEIEGYCQRNHIDYTEDDDLNLSNIRLRMEANRLHRLQSKVGFPQYFVFGFPRTGTESLINSMIQCKELLFGRDRNGRAVRFFEDEKVEASNWNKGNNWYMSHFPRTLEKRWFDYSANLTASFDNSVDRFGKVFKDWFWDGFDKIKFVFFLRNPVERAVSHYSQFMQYFPASYMWHWCNPGESIQQNIKSELNSDMKCGDFLKDGCYIDYITTIKDKLNLSDKNIHIVTLEQLTGQNKKYHYEKLKKFLKVKNFKEIPRLNQSEYNHNVKKSDIEKIKDFYLEYNKKLFDFIGYEIDEWR